MRERDSSNLPEARSTTDQKPTVNDKYDVSDPKTLILLTQRQSQLRGRLNLAQILSFPKDDEALAPLLQPTGTPYGLQIQLLSYYR